MTLVTLRAAQSKILKVWNNIDKRINKYHVEAADNAKFLGAIEKTSHSIYLEDPAQMKESLMRVIHIVKMIYNVSHHYNTPERVASLLVKITNQVKGGTFLNEKTTKIQYQNIKIKLKARYLTIYGCNGIYF